MYGTLIPIGGGDDIPLKKKELIVGRKEDCDIVLRFSNVSSHHCRLVLANGYWYILDMNSSNGVKVNGMRVLDRRIDPGAKIMISKHAFTIDYDPAENGAHGAPPPDMLETDIFSKSLMERAGLAKSSNRLDADSHGSGSHSASRQTQSESSKNHEIDFSAFTLDDIDLR